MVYSQRDALFRGAEFQAQFDLVPVGGGMFGIDGQYDIVRATFSDGSNVPRLPPQRYGGGVFWRDANWFARVGLLHADAQTNVAENETTTAGYNLLKAVVSYSRMLKNAPIGPTEVTLGLVGDNLLNDDVRNARFLQEGRGAAARPDRPGLRFRAILTGTFRVNALSIREIYRRSQWLKRSPASSSRASIARGCRAIRSASSRISTTTSIG